MATNLGSNYLIKVKERLSKDNRKLLYLAVSGSHAWGLQRPDSDVDLRGVYQDPTDKVLSIHPGSDNIEFTKDDSTSAPLDVQLYEIEKFLGMLLKNNGNMVTFLNLPLVLYCDKSVIPWKKLSGIFSTRKLKTYYKGYADSQRKRALSQRGGKALIYTYREMFAGLYLMRYGKMIFDFKILWKEAEHNSWYTEGLLYKYFGQENINIPISDSDWDKFYSEWEELTGKLEKESQTSPLPENNDGYEFCNNLLLTLRKQNMVETWLSRQ